MADGSIRIETKLDNSALKKQIKELERELNNIQKEKAKTDAQLGQLRSKYDAEREFDAQFPEEFSQRQDIDARATQELDPIIAKQEELNQKEQQYLSMLDAAKSKLAEQANVMDASKQVDAAVKAEAPIASVQSQAEYNSLLDATASKMAAIEAAAGHVATQTGLSKEQILAANPAYQRLSDTMGMLKAKAGDFGDEAKNASKKAATGLKSASKEAKGFGNSIKSGIKKLGRLSLALVGIRSIYGAIRSAVTSYLSSNEDLSNQLEAVKNVFAQAFGPAIESAINLILRAVYAVNALIFAMSGINLVAKANAAALKKQEKATSGAAKAANQLAGFDEQTKLSDTSGGGGGSGDGVTLLDESMQNLPTFIEEMKAQITAGDWYGAGQTAGEALMDGLESIDWEGIGTNIGNVIGGALGFAIGFAFSIDPLTIVESIGEFAIGLLNSLSESLKNLDWNQIGHDIAGLLLGAMLTAVFGLVPGLIMSFLLSEETKNFVFVALGFLVGLIPGLIIAILLSGKGPEFASAAAKFVGTLLGSLLSAIVGAAQGIWDIAKTLWNTLVEWFDTIDWGGTPGEIIAGLWQGIKDALKGVGDWIYNNIWVPFRDAFKESFDINSPSKKMMEFGGYIIDGLRNGITNGINKIKQACTDIWTAIKEKFANVGTWFKEKFSDAWQKVKDVFSTKGKIFDGIKEGIAETFKIIVNGLISGINRIISTPFNRINTLLNTIRSISVLGVEPFKGMWSYNPLSVPQIPKLALGGIVNRPGRGVPAIIGEAGAEAVLPLENNTEWMDILADKIGGGNVTIPIYMDGKKIATYVVDIQNKKAFAMNGA